MQPYFKRFLRNFDYPLFFTFLILYLIWSCHDLQFEYGVGRRSIRLGARPFF